MINKIDWDSAIFFFDVDDTLIDTASNSIVASEGIYDGLVSLCGEEKARKIQKQFCKIFRTLMLGHMAKNANDWQQIEGGKAYHDDVVHRIEEYQKPILNSYGIIKKWSREVFLKIVADEFSLALGPQEITKLIDLYWVKLSEISSPMPGVLELFQEIKRHNRPVYLITSSDARLEFADDFLFYYNPKHSEKFKIERMKALKNKGIFYNAVSIGDPEDKPHKDFFEKGLMIATRDLQTEINTKNILMFGDSYAGDLETPKDQLGFGLVVLFKKDQPNTIEESNRYISTGNLLRVTDYLQ